MKILELLSPQSQATNATTTETINRILLPSKESDIEKEIPEYKQGIQPVFPTFPSDKAFESVGTVESDVKSTTVDETPIIQPVLRSTTTTPQLQSKIDETPTGKFFDDTGVVSYKITEIRDKCKFISWTIEQISVQQIDEETMDDLVTHILYGYTMYNDITTGHKLVLQIESYLDRHDIKYRKILNLDRKQDL